MPIISKTVRVANKRHLCNQCERWRIGPGDRYTRLFGSADPGDPPYAIKVCLYCKDPDAPEPDGYDYIRERYGVPVRLGMTVEAEGQKGIIVRPEHRPAHYLSVKVQREDRKQPSVEVWHPTWETVYYNEDGTVAADYRKAREVG